MMVSVEILEIIQMPQEWLKPDLRACQVKYSKIYWIDFENRSF